MNDRAPVWITAAAVAELLAVSERTLRRWHAAGEGPPRRVFGGVVRYHAPSVHQWAASRASAPATGTRSTRPTRRIVTR